MKNSTTILLPKWFSLLEELELSLRMIPRDVSTRWNSTFDMLNFALEYQTAIKTITSDRDLNLRQFELSKTEWTNTQHLRDVLKVFKDVTLFFSQGKPNINSVIPAMDFLDQQLTDNLLKSRYSTPVKSAINLGRKTLNRYYDMTDHSEIYRIAMGKYYSLGTDGNEYDFLMFRV